MAGGAPPALLVITNALDIPWQLLRLPEVKNYSRGPFFAEAFALTCSMPGGGEALHVPCSELVLVATRCGEFAEAVEAEATMFLGLHRSGLRKTQRIKARYREVADGLQSDRFDG